LLGFDVIPLAVPASSNAALALLRLPVIPRSGGAPAPGAGHGAACAASHACVGVRSGAGVQAG